jgi:Haem-binding domain
VIGLLGLALVGAQFIGPARTNPTIDRTVELGTAPVPPPVVSVLRRACYDCHSSETRWPWYAHVAPASWLVVSDVQSARRQLSFSRWGRYNAFDRADLLDKMCDQVSKARMPLWQYRLVHADARLADADIATVCTWTADESARLTQEAK